MADFLLDQRAGTRASPFAIVAFEDPAAPLGRDASLRIAPGERELARWVATVYCFSLATIEGESEPAAATLPERWCSPRATAWWSALRSARIT